eukprot:g10734.t1
MTPGNYTTFLQPKNEIPCKTVKKNYHELIPNPTFGDQFERACHDFTDGMLFDEHATCTAGEVGLTADACFATPGAEQLKNGLPFEPKRYFGTKDDPDSYQSCCRKQPEIPCHTVAKMFQGTNYMAMVYFEMECFDSWTNGALFDDYATCTATAVDEPAFACLAIPGFEAKQKTKDANGETKWVSHVPHRIVFGGRKSIGHPNGYQSCCRTPRTDSVALPAPYGVADELEKGDDFELKITVTDSDVMAELDDEEVANSTVITDIADLRKLNNFADASVGTTSVGVEWWSEPVGPQRALWSWIVGWDRDCKWLKDEEGKSLKDKNGYCKDKRFFYGQRKDDTFTGEPKLTAEGDAVAWVYKKHDNAKHANVIHAATPDLSRADVGHDDAVAQLANLYTNIFNQLKWQSWDNSTSTLRMIGHPHDMVGPGGKWKRLPEWTAEALDRAWYKNLKKSDRQKLANLEIKFCIYEHVQGEVQEEDESDYSAYKKAFENLEMEKASTTKDGKEPGPRRWRRVVDAGKSNSQRPEANECGKSDAGPPRKKGSTRDFPGTRKPAFFVLFISLSLAVCVRSNHCAWRRGTRPAWRRGVPLRAPRKKGSTWDFPGTRKPAAKTTGDPAAQSQTLQAKNEIPCATIKKNYPGWPCHDAWNGMAFDEHRTCTAGEVDRTADGDACFATPGVEEHHNKTDAEGNVVKDANGNTMWFSFEPKRWFGTPGVFNSYQSCCRQTPIPCKTVKENYHQLFEETGCYDKGMRFDEHATCTAGNVGRTADACFATPGVEEQHKKTDAGGNVVLDANGDRVPQWVSFEPKRWFGTPGDSNSYQSCCRKPGTASVAPSEPSDSDSGPVSSPDERVERLDTNRDQLGSAQSAWSRVGGSNSEIITITGPFIAEKKMHKMQSTQKMQEKVLDILATLTKLQKQALELQENMRYNEGEDVLTEDDQGEKQESEELTKEEKEEEEEEEEEEGVPPETKVTDGPR